MNKSIGFTGQSLTNRPYNFSMLQLNCATSVTESELM